MAPLEPRAGLEWLPVHRRPRRGWLSARRELSLVSTRLGQRLRVPRIVQVPRSPPTQSAGDDLLQLRGNALELCDAAADIGQVRASNRARIAARYRRIVVQPRSRTPSNTWKISGARTGRDPQGHRQQIAVAGSSSYARLSRTTAVRSLCASSSVSTIYRSVVYAVKSRRRRRRRSF